MKVLGRPTVVIADDEVHIVDVLAMLFEFYDVDIIKAYNGEQALLAVREHTPALLIADIMMPKLSGVEVCDRVKEDPTLAQTAVILMSALPLEVLPPMSADGYLSKPFELRQVEQYAGQYIGHQ